MAHEWSHPCSFSVFGGINGSLRQAIGLVWRIFIYPIVLCTQLDPEHQFGTGQSALASAWSGCLCWVKWGTAASAGSLLTWEGAWEVLLIGPFGIRQEGIKLPAGARQCWGGGGCIQDFVGHWSALGTFSSYTEGVGVVGTLIIFVDSGVVRKQQKNHWQWRLELEDPIWSRVSGLSSIALSISSVIIYVFCAVQSLRYEWAVRGKALVVLSDSRGKQRQCQR